MEPYREKTMDSRPSAWGHKEAKLIYPILGCPSDHSVENGSSKSNLGIYKSLKGGLHDCVLYGELEIFVQQDEPLCSNQRSSFRKLITKPHSRALFWGHSIILNSGSLGYSSHIGGSTYLGTADFC